MKLTILKRGIKNLENPFLPSLVLKKYAVGSKKYMLDVKAYGLLFCYNAKKMGRYMMGWGCSGGRSTKGAYKEMKGNSVFRRHLVMFTLCRIQSNLSYLCDLFTLFSKGLFSFP